MADRYSDDYRYRGGRGYDEDRTVEGSGYGGRNWAERAGDEVASWVGDRDAEQRRERDRQTIGRYPGEDRGERNYGGGYASSSYGRSDYGRSGYGDDRDQRSGYRGYEGRSYGDDRTVQGSGYGGRNWAERAGDEAASWFGDRDAEQRREKDRQTIGRYPGEDRGERNYGGSSSYGSGSYGGGAYGGRSYSGASYGRDDDRTVQGSGYAGRNWAERSGDEVSSWFGDRDAEQRREKDRQTIGRYPGEDRGERNYGGSSTYGRDRDDSRAHYSQALGYTGRDAGRSYGASARDNDDDRGFFSRAADEVRSWFGDDDAERRRERDTMRDDARDAFAGSGARTGGSSGAGFGAATGMSTSNYANDPHYSAYRSARMAEYDRDYDEYRKSKSTEFANDFTSWRSARSAGSAAGAAAMSATAFGGGSDLAGKIKEHAKVVGSDGQTVGEVDRVTGSDIKLAKKDSPDGKHHLIPVSWVASVDGETVKLSKSAADAKREWRDGDSAAAGMATPGTATSTTQTAAH